jgi:hypothetical protein
MNLISGFLYFNVIFFHATSSCTLERDDPPLVTMDIEYWQAPDNTGKMISLLLDVYQQPKSENLQRPVNTFPVTAETLPICIIHGITDKVVYYDISRNLWDSLTKAGV